MRIYVGIDNGVSGSIGWVSAKKSRMGFVKTPVFGTQNYQKKGARINRVDTGELSSLLEDTVGIDKQIQVYIERPMVNPQRFQASASALRALEATLICIEGLGLPHEFVDSKQWQKELLPSVKGSDALKKASLDVGTRLFPDLKEEFGKDADGILIAEWARRNNL